ncbi:Protein of unknown function [Propionibacterium freudenreichii]|nr:Protein of unknown function [Propionibacterium freudenreichii]CEI29784.1 Protein of unknown function [Propionibacterium freudenreichii]CEI46097.1 Protein of unknown function [Propionibacterium freudenreichii]
MAEVRRRHRARGRQRHRARSALVDATHEGDAA